ncbi:MAG: thioredoxin family protein [Anaerolineales bacterium]
MDGIEQRHAAELVVIRLNIQEPVGKLVGERYRFQYTPTFIFFDSQGEELWRQVGSIDPDQVSRSLQTP